MPFVPQSKSGQPEIMPTKTQTAGRQEFLCSGNLQSRNVHKRCGTFVPACFGCQGGGIGTAPRKALPASCVALFLPLCGWVIMRHINSLPMVGSRIITYPRGFMRYASITGCADSLVSHPYKIAALYDSEGLETRTFPSDGTKQSLGKFCIIEGIAGARAALLFESSHLRPSSCWIRLTAVMYAGRWYRKSRPYNRISSRME